MALRVVPRESNLYAVLVMMLLEAYGKKVGSYLTRFIGFSRAVESAPDTSEDKVLYPPFNPISRQSDFRVKGS